MGRRESWTWGFWRRLLGGGGLTADLETWMGLPQLGWSACPNLDQENWPCRNRALGTIAQSSMLANLKIPPSLFFSSLSVSYFSSRPPSYFLPSLMILSGNPGTYLLILPPTSREPQTTPALGHTGWPKPYRSPCCSGTGWQQLQRPPIPLDSVLSNAN